MIRGEKLEETGETGRNGETEEKIRPNVKTIAYLFYNPFGLSFFFGENMFFLGENLFFLVKTYFSW